MASSTVTDTPGGVGADARQASGSRWTARGSLGLAATAVRRRRVPHLVVGLLLVVACTVGVVLLSQQMADRQPVLVVARPVTAGQVLTPADVTQANVAADAGVAVVEAGQLGEVLGRPAAVDLRPGSLLSEPLLGPAEVPAAGESVVALAVQPGRYPPRLQAGASVLVVPVAGQTAPAEGWDAVVLDVSGSGQGTVLTLSLADTDAREVAALAEDAASVVLVAGGDR